MPFMSGTSILEVARIAEIEEEEEKTGEFNREARKQLRMMKAIAGKKSSRVLQMQSFLWDHNTVESIMLGSAITINLAGLMFESTANDIDYYKSERDFVTWVVMFVIFFSSIYYFLVLFSELFAFGKSQKDAKMQEEIIQKEMEMQEIEKGPADGLKMMENPLQHVEVIQADELNSTINKLRSENEVGLSFFFPFIPFPPNFNSINVRCSVRESRNSKSLMKHRQRLLKQVQQQERQDALVVVVNRERNFKAFSFYWRLVLSQT